MRVLLLLCAMLLASAAAAVAQGNYLIQPGDRLVVTVVEDNSFNTQALVAPDGNISVPGAGSIRAAGLSTTAVARVVTSRLSSQFQVTPTVSVALGNLGNPQANQQFNIYVIGEVSRPGLLQVEPGTTILQALAQAGGLTQFAADKRVQMRRYNHAAGRDIILIFNYAAIERGAHINRHVHLREGDILVVPERRLFE